MANSTIPFFSPVPGGSAQEQADAFATWMKQSGYQLDGTSNGPQFLLSSAPFSGQMNPYWSMASFYNVPLTHSTPRKSGKTYTSGTYYPPGVYPPGMGGSSGSGGGSGSGSGSGSGTGTVFPNTGTAGLPAWWVEWYNKEGKFGGTPPVQGLL